MQVTITAKTNCTEKLRQQNAEHV